VLRGFAAIPPAEDSVCDGAIMVIAPGKVSSSEALDVKNQLDKSGCKILGAILNDAYGKRSKYYKKYYKDDYSIPSKKKRSK